MVVSLALRLSHLSKPRVELFLCCKGSFFKGKLEMVRLIKIIVQFLTYKTYFLKNLLDPTFEQIRWLYK